MMPQGHPSLLRSKSGMLGGQGRGGTPPSQNAFVSLSSNLNVLGNNVPYLNSSGQQFCHPMLTADQQHQQQFNVASNSQQHAHQFQAMRSGRVQQTANEQSLQTSVKMEPQQIQSIRSLDSSLFFPQQQQFLMSQAQISHQQRLVQLQSHEFQHQVFPIRSPVKPVYEPGMCARRLTHYMYQQQHKPEDNNIHFWRKFVAEFFAPNAKKKLCVSMYGSARQNTGVSPQDVWHCEICNRKPGRGFEATVEVLPRLFKIKYESGTLDELLYVDMPREYQNSSGQIVLDYAKAIQESIFEQVRVVRDGHLRIVFSPDLKICSWEFCARCHEELIPRRLLVPQVSQVGTAAQKCLQAATQNTSPSSSSVSELQNNCNMFVASAHQLAKAVQVPLVNDLGLSKRYVRCLQISEVVNSMKNLMDYSSETGAGPIESLAKFPRRTLSTSSSSQQPAESHQRQQMGQNSKNDDDNNLQPISPVNMANSPNMDAVQKIMHMSSQLGSGEGTLSDVKNVDGDNDILVGTGLAKASYPKWDPNNAWE